jgi:hypothetical protein
MYWAIGALVMFLVWFFWPSKSKPLYYRGQTRAQLLRFIEGLFSQGGTGLQLFIDHEGSERFWQFEKGGTGENRHVFYAFPDAEWSRAFYGTVADRLRAGGFRCTEQNTGREDVRRYWVVDRLDTADRVMSLFDVVADALGLPANATFQVHYEGPISLVESARWQRDRKRLDAAT